MSGTIHLLPLCVLHASSGTNFTCVLAYKIGSVENPCQGITRVLQSKTDIGPLFVHCNLWRYIGGICKSKYCIMNLFSQTFMAAKFGFDYI
jgi:hypothetical protein